jgi:hypothetical protein
MGGRVSGRYDPSPLPQVNSWRTVNVQAPPLPGENLKAALPTRQRGWSRSQERTLGLVRPFEIGPVDSVPRMFRLPAVIRAIDQGCCEGGVLNKAIGIIKCAGAH